MATQLAVTSPSDLSKLLNPGRPVSLAYQNRSNTEVATEDLSSDNRFTQQFSSLQLGSDGVSINIPNQHIITDTVVHLAFPNLPDDVYLPRGWAIRLIDEVSIHIAGATPIRYTYRELLNQLMRDADTDSKRDQVMRLAGEEVTTGPSAGFDPPVVAHLPLPLPWSCIRHLSEKVGLDSALMNQNLRIVLRLARSDEVFSGAGVYPTSLTRAYVQMRQLSFKKAAQQTVRAAMLADPTALYSYHFVYPQPNVSSIFTGSIDPSNQVTVNLSGFQSGNLTSIVFMLQNQNDVQTGTFVRNPLRFEMMKNMEITWNGQILYRTDEESDGGEWCLSESLAGICSANTSYAAAGQTTSPFTTIPDKLHWAVQLMVPRDEACATDLIMEGENMSNQTIVVRFNTTGTDEYRLYTTFNYTANAVVHRQNAQIQFV